MASQGVRRLLAGSSLPSMAMRFKYTNTKKKYTNTRHGHEVQEHSSQKSLLM